MSKLYSLRNDIEKRVLGDSKEEDKKIDFADLLLSTWDGSGRDTLLIL
jgi:hypothetical protein